MPFPLTRIAHLPSLYTSVMPPEVLRQRTSSSRALVETRGGAGEASSPHAGRGERQSTELLGIMRLNQRASWVAGRAVMGDALLAVARINRGKGGTIWGVRAAHPPDHPAEPLNRRLKPLPILPWRPSSPG